VSQNDTAIAHYDFNVHQTIFTNSIFTNGVRAIISLHNLPCLLVITSLICCKITFAEMTHF